MKKMCIGDLFNKVSPISKYVGDIGKLRKVLHKINYNPSIRIFNDKRKTFRRLKIWHISQDIDFILLTKYINEEFSSRVIKITIEPTTNWYRKNVSVCVYLHL